MLLHLTALFVLFWEKSAFGWPGWRIFWPRNDLAPLLRWRRHCLQFVCLSVCLWAILRKTTDRIFTKISPEMCLWTRKNGLNFGPESICNWTRIQQEYFEAFFNVTGKTDRIFMKILSQMCSWTFWKSYGSRSVVARRLNVHMSYRLSIKRIYFYNFFYVMLVSLEKRMLYFEWYAFSSATATWR